MHDDHSITPERFSIYCLEHLNGNDIYHTYLALMKETKDGPLVQDELHFRDESFEADEMPELKGYFRESNRNLDNERIHLWAHIAGDEDYISQMWDHAAESVREMNRAGLLYTRSTNNCRAGVVKVLESLGLEYTKPEDLGDDEIPYGMEQMARVHLAPFEYRENKAATRDQEEADEPDEPLGQLSHA